MIIIRASAKCFIGTTLSLSLEDLHSDCTLVISGEKSKIFFFFLDLYQESTTLKNMLTNYGGECNINM